MTPQTAPCGHACLITYRVPVLQRLHRIARPTRLDGQLLSRQQRCYCTTPAATYGNVYNAANSGAAAANKVSKFGDTMTGDLTVPVQHLSSSGGALTADATYVRNIFASDGRQWRYTRASGALAYTVAMMLRHCSQSALKADTSCIRSDQATFVALPTVDYAGITADANYTYFLMDSQDGNYEYNRSTGDLEIFEAVMRCLYSQFNYEGDTTA